MFELADDQVFIKLEEDELRDPSSRKELDGRTVYRSRDLEIIPGKIGVEHFEDVQPDIYRAPEVILGAPWSYSIDIWNVRCMVRY